MTKVKAFVGHSFLEKDEAVVRSFLDYFDQIQGFGVDFEWDHARPAEPRELAAKVLSAIEGKNLFVGICTMKERVVDPNSLKRAKFSHKKLIASEVDFHWKTSDWIIQEIGLAIGRGMNLLLLVEKGVRIPGGLQGNLEVIEFERKEPHRTFGRILEMLHALLPKVITKKSEETGPKESSNNALTADDSEAEELIPNPQWDKNQFDRALMRSILSDDGKREREIFDAYLASEGGANPENAAAWRAFSEYIHILSGRGGKLSNLEKLADENINNSEVRSRLATCYERFDEYKKAAEVYESIANLATLPVDKARALGAAAVAHQKSGNGEQASRIVDELRTVAHSNRESQIEVLNAIKSVANLRGDLDTFFGSCEYILDLQPDNYDVRFDLAYKYSQESIEKLSLFHYLRIPQLERSGASWNNLGVQFEHFELSGKSVDAYRAAEEKGETLAMSNLAQRFIGAGFLKEAREICDEALKIEDFHPNVSSAITRIKELPDEESTKLNELSGQAEPASEFYRKYGNALVKPHISNIEGSWRGPKCELQIVINGRAFHAQGEYEAYTNSGIMLALRGGSNQSTNQSVGKKLTYTGTVNGSAISCVKFESEINLDYGATASGLMGDNSGIAVLMVYSPQSQEFSVLEKSSQGEFKSFTLSKVTH